MKRPPLRAVPEGVRLLVERFPEWKLDALLVSALPNIRYLTGFTGSNALLAITPGGGLLCASIFAVLWFFYEALFSICCSDTPGMHWMGLRLVSFSGDRPDREERIYRIFGSALSFLSAGIGLVWSLVDEEQLTWHDHISKTFPSPSRS